MLLVVCCAFVALGFFERFNQRFCLHLTNLKMRGSIAYSRRVSSLATTNENNRNTNHDPTPHSARSCGARQPTCGGQSCARVPKAASAPLVSCCVGAAKFLPFLHLRFALLNDKTAQPTPRTAAPAFRAPISAAQTRCRTLRAPWRLW